MIAIARTFPEKLPAERSPAQQLEHVLLASIDLRHRLLASCRSLVQVDILHPRRMSRKGAQPKAFRGIGVGGIARIFEYGCVPPGPTTALCDGKAGRVVVGMPALECGTDHGARPHLADEPIEHRARLVEDADQPTVRQAQQMATLDADHVHGLPQLVLAHMIESIVAARRHPRRIHAHACTHQQGQCSPHEEIVVRMGKHKQDGSGLVLGALRRSRLAGEKIDHAASSKYAVR